MAKNIKQECPCCGSVDCYEVLNTPYIECGGCYIKVTKLNWHRLTEKADELKRTRRNHGR